MPTHEEQIEGHKNQGHLCCNGSCKIRISCARFYDEYRAENKGKPVPNLYEFHEPEDACYVMRRQLEGSMENHRHFQSQTKYHRRGRSREVKTGMPKGLL